MIDVPLPEAIPAVSAPSSGDDDLAGPQPGTEVEGGPATVRRRWPAVARTVVAGLVVVLPLAAPDGIDHPTLVVLARLPMEALVAAALLVVVPHRVRPALVAAAAAGLSLVAVLKIVDIGFDATLGRQFDLVVDWGLLGSGVGVLRDSIGTVGTAGAVIGAVLLVAAGAALVAVSVRHLSRLAVRRRAATARVVAVLAVVWVACAALGVHLVPGVPVADRNTAALLGKRVEAVGDGLRDRRTFAREAAVDPFEDVPGDRLLAGLRGKDVVVAFVESYGRSALEDPRMSSGAKAVLDAGTRRLRAAGFGSRSAFLASPTRGGQSWLAHGTLASGLWIDDQQRYRTLTASNRLTLGGAFRRAGWRTVSVEPATGEAWPERAFFGYEKVYDLDNLEYRGPRFSYATMPDQYTLAAFQRAERRPGHAPVMASISLVSSHAPWAPLPRMVGWDEVGDGTVYAPMPAAGEQAGAVSRDRGRLRAAYGKAMAYSLESLVSYVERYGDDDLVLVFLGDHQPASYVTGARASRDVPVTLVTRDRHVLDRVAGWGWHDGLRPGPAAPVWPMNAFRDRFLTAFGA